MPGDDAKVVFVADAHLTGDLAAADELIAYLETALRGAVGLYMLGDMFNYLIGVPAFRTPGDRRLFDHLHELAHRGLTVGYVGGNRDYFLAPIFERQSRVAFTETALDIAPFDIPIHLAHGDTINSDDRQYLRWRRVTHSKAMGAFISAVPKFAARRLGDRFERRIRATNQNQRIRFPEAPCRAYAASAIERGAELVVLGHFHEPRTLKVAAGKRLGTMYVLPDWLSRRTHAELYEDGRFVLDARSPQIADRHGNPSAPAASAETASPGGG